MGTEENSIETIEELDLVVTGDPTNVWLLSEDQITGNFRVYEQWEKGRPFKAKAIYHHSSGDDFYLRNEDDPFGIRDLDTSSPLFDERQLAPERPGHRHQVKYGEDIYSIGLHYKIPWQKVLEHNELESPEMVKEGQWLYIPTPHESKERQDIEYRLLEEPRPMHVSHIGGTTKYSFGGVKVLTDIKAELKHYDQDHNITIHAIAKVPIEENSYAYYMDKHDLGSYSETSRPAYTRGYNWSHLADGHITVEKPATKMDKIVADAMAEDDRPALPERHEIIPAVILNAPPKIPGGPTVELDLSEDIPETLPSPLEVELDDYKKTFKYLNVEESPEEFEMLEDHSIRELDGAMPPKFRKAGAKVPINGWFTYKGTPYFRVATKYWYAIPTQMAYPTEDEPFNDLSLSLKERATYGGSLTREEQRVVRMAKIAAKYNKVKTFTSLLKRK